MLINDDTKLDYSDVLIRPKRSTLTSRFDVDLERKYKFKHSQKNWEGTPIMASNMDTVGTFSMADELTQHHMITCIAKHYNATGSWPTRNHLNENHLCVMGGISEQDINNTQKIYKSLIWTRLERFPWQMN